MKKNPAIAFSEFVNAWSCYEIMPESLREDCEEMVKHLREMWNVVAKAEIDNFYFLCNAIIARENGADERISVVCLELLEEIAAFNGKVPEANNILISALNVIACKYQIASSCSVLLYVLCARTWNRCLGLSSKAEMALLLEGIKCHQSVKAGDIISSTEMYAIHLAAAIDDIICIRHDSGISSAKIVGLAKEGYMVLDRFDTLNADAARRSLYNSSGILEEMALYGERRYSILHRRSKQMVS